MGYCPFEHKAGRRRAGGVRRQAAGRLALGGRWALGAWGQLGSGRWGLLGARRGTGAGHATMGAQARLSWVHCAPASVLTQFLDSVLFPSHFLDTVHEPGS